MGDNNRDTAMSKAADESDTEFSNDDSSQRNFKDFQVVVNSKNQVVIKNLGGSGGGGKKRQPKGAEAGGSTSRKLKHESFNKSIYIGTKNAEKWDKLRSKLKYKNDVEFVSFLLNLVEKYVALDESTSNR